MYATFPWFGIIPIMVVEYLGLEWVNTDVNWHHMSPLKRLYSLSFRLTQLVNAVVTCSPFKILGFRLKNRALYIRASEIQSTSQHRATALQYVYTILYKILHFSLKHSLTLTLIRPPAFSHDSHIGESNNSKRYVSCFKISLSWGVTCTFSKISTSWWQLIIITNFLVKSFFSFVIVISKLLKRHPKAKHRAPAY